ncbi:nuclease-related domain-containing protein [Streptomyces sp. NPDC096310]|uniref:nuclease-related domain-containing protein n=1 Tax=Streptomyces sp. NPDC096310 TaxID=3366082 RepID=UPI0037FE7474
MDNLEVSPWKRYGHNRLYVRVVGGESVAWCDLKSGHIEILDVSYRRQVLDALAPYLTNVEPPAASEFLAVEGSSRPAPDDDLAWNRPGAQLLRHLEDAPSWFARLLMRLLGQEDESAPWRKGLAGEKIVGAELDRLRSRGWMALHSIPLPSGADIDHLLIGPGGVFCLNTKNFSDARVWVGDNAVKVNGGSGHPYLRNSRNEGRRASTTLARACGVAISVTPVLVFVSPAKLDVVPSLHDVQAIKHRDLSSFRKKRGILRPEEIELVYSAARIRHTWAIT